MKKQTIKKSDFRKIVSGGNLTKIKNYLKTAKKPYVLKKDADGRNALYDAIFTHDFDIIKALVEYGFNPLNIDDNTGISALHLAAAERLFDVVAYLMFDAGVDVNVLDYDGRNPLYYALLFMVNDDDSINSDARNIARLLISRGAYYQHCFHGSLNELQALQHALISDIYKIIYEKNNMARPRLKANIKFLIDMFNDYNSMFITDVPKYMMESEPVPQIRSVTDINLYETDEFKHSGYKMPVVLGWKVRDWDASKKLSVQKYPVLLAKQFIKPVVCDLTTISPLLINTGDTEHMMNFFIEELYECLLETDYYTKCHMIFIENKPDLFGMYDTDIACRLSLFNNMKNATQAVKEISEEIDRRKKLSAYELKDEQPVICFINHLNDVIGNNKKTLGYVQNILNNGAKAKMYIIAVNGGKLPDIVRANFQSVITWHTQTAAESTKYIGHDCATNLRMDEMFFVSPFISGTQPVHIKMH